MAFIQVSFMSKTLMRTVPLQVILPVDKFTFGQPEREEKPFKTLYLLHGIFGNETDWVHGTRIQRWAEEKNLAVVMPAGENAFYVDQPSIGAMHGQFIGEELVEITRKMFPLSRKREDTFIGGLSMGGFGALRLGSLYHETFGKLFTLSGAFIIDNISGQKAGYSDSIADYDYYVRTFGDLDCLKDSEKDPMYCVKKAVLQKNMPEVYQAVGTEDFLIEENRMMKKYLEKEGVKVTYHEAEGIHDWSFWNKYLPEAVEWLLK